MTPPHLPSLEIRRRRLMVFFILLLVIGIDQGSKHLAREYVPHSGISYLNGLMRLSLVENHGGFLGIVADLPEYLRLFFLIGCVGLLLGACLAYLIRSSNRRSFFWFPLACITGGGLSNLLDRLHGDGGVTDFLILGTGVLRTGIFNLADVFILVGSFVLGFQVFRLTDDSP